MDEVKRKAKQIAARSLLDASVEARELLASCSPRSIHSIAHHSCDKPLEVARAFELSLAGAEAELEPLDELVFAVRCR